jgi:5-methylcytosine-specific restriction enzyme subunit McrC
MRFQYVLLEEYSKDPAIVSFSNEEEAKKIQEKIKKSSGLWKEVLSLSKDPFETNLEANKIEIFAKGITGFIRIDNLQIEIAPKFLSRNKDSNEWRTALTRALFITNQQKFFDKNQTSSNKTDSFLSDLMAETFLDSLELGINLGLPRAYNEKREMLPFYRGSYDSQKFISHLYKPHLIPCKYDEYTTENLINQMLKTASIELSKSVYSTSLAVRLIELANSIEARYQVPSVIQIESIFVPPQYNYLIEAVEIAKLLFQNKSLEHNVGDNSLKGFLWDSATVFEKIVKLIIKTYCIRSKRYQFTDKPLTLIQFADRYTVSRIKVKVETTPDVRILQSNETKFLLDAKYKIWTRQPKNEDVYQVMAGARVSDCKLASLVYPLPEDRGSETLIYNVEGKEFPKVVSIIFIDITKLAYSNGLNELVKKFEKDLSVLSN